MPFKSAEELEEIRKNLYDITWPLVTDFENKNWSLKGGHDKEKTGLVFKGHHDKLGTIWKFEAILEITHDDYFEHFIKRGELQDWVPHLAEYRFLEKSEGSDDWNVTYSQTKGMAAVSSRDFVSINFHKRLEDGSHLIMTVATDHPDAPKHKGCVRGEYLPSACLLRPVKDNPNRGEIIWLNNADMKGYMLRSLINMIMTTFTLEYGSALIAKAHKMAAAKSNH